MPSHLMTKPRKLQDSIGDPDFAKSQSSVSENTVNIMAKTDVPQPIQGHVSGEHTKRHVLKLKEYKYRKDDSRQHTSENSNYKSQKT